MQDQSSTCVRTLKQITPRFQQLKLVLRSMILLWNSLENLSTLRRQLYEEERKKKPITFNCKWCKKQVRGGHNSDANLRKHRDGSNQTGRDGSGCPNRSLAIQAGAKIPPTVNETRAQAEKKDNGGPKLTAFFGRTEKFDKKILNQILMIWQTRNALPWSRIEDFDLQAAFHYCQSDAILFKRKWVASEAKQLYVSLQGTMLQMLKKSSSKFTLVHDVWTTKGNRYAFIGSSVAYINENGSSICRISL
ncbi:hypothetical protein PGT21_017720 [Puccinia graminis f. sp. tritici]|uniref:BED-type domain-containing protein n=1 Tax=Puccinia graminis f. sp. tritici TaxID=56615 RepID=A0A5B0PG96_PUCGR|nr:hypothetical protein PGT21_017720 [Puccinia graminis f. sp. tritici]